jgi:hypothetical protein
MVGSLPNDFVSTASAAPGPALGRGDWTDADRSLTKRTGARYAAVNVRVTRNAAMGGGPGGVGRYDPTRPVGGRSPRRQAHRALQRSTRWTSAGPSISQDEVVKGVHHRDDEGNEQGKCPSHHRSAAAARGQTGKSVPTVMNPFITGVMNPFITGVMNPLIRGYSHRPDRQASEQALYRSEQKYRHFLG